MDDIKEVAKAVQGVAKFGEKSLETSEKIGGFLSRVFNEPFQELSGIITDKLKYIRWKKLIKMSDDVDEILLERGITNTRPVTPKLALPIIQDSTLEEEEELSDLWTHLLANAMDPEYNGDLRYGFIDMIKNITGVEATILKNFYDVLNKDGYTQDLSKINQYTLTKEQIMGLVNIDDVTYQLSLYNLMRMHCLQPAIFKSTGVALGNEPITINKGTDVVVMTPLGATFVQACMK